MVNDIPHGAAQSEPPPRGFNFGTSTSFLSISGLSIGPGPIFATLGLALLVFFVTGFVNRVITIHLGMQRNMAMPWLAHYIDHVAMFAFSFALVAWLSKGRPSTYGVQLPKRKSYVLPAIAWGALFGILMTVVDYLPDILAHRPPEQLSLTAGSVAGWLGFQFLWVGFGEELAFRGLLQTFLMLHSSGRVRLGKFQMHIAGVMLALLFALAHISYFWQRPFWIALAQQFYAFALGILYAYWREKSSSLVASIVGHNVSDGVEYSLMFLLKWVWQ